MGIPSLSPLSSLDLYGQRRREEFKKALEGALKFFPGIKIKPEQELCFSSRPRKLKERCTRSMEKPHIPASAETMSEYWFHKPGQRRRYQCFKYLSSDLQHPAVKRVLLV